MENTISGTLKCISMAGQALRRKESLTRLGFLFCSWRITILKMFCLYLIQEPMQRLVRDILFDNYVREICKSELALAFLMRGFPNYTQLHQGLSQSLVFLSGISTRTWYMWNSIHRLHCKPVKINGATTPKDLYGFMNKGTQVQLTIASKIIL